MEIGMNLPVMAPGLDRDAFLKWCERIDEGFFASLAAGDRIAMLRLETGIHNTEALRTYRRAGYRERNPFGDYAPDPLSVFMEKRLG